MLMMGQEKSTFITDLPKESTPILHRLVLWNYVYEETLQMVMTSIGGVFRGKAYGVENYAFIHVKWAVREKSANCEGITHFCVF